MNTNVLIEKLSHFGLSKEEAIMYCYLLEVKSATIHEIHKNDYFSQKKRPNLYKILKNLQKKKFVISEEKGNKTKFYASDPIRVITLFIEKQEKKLEEIKLLGKVLSESLEDINKIPNKNFNLIPPILQEYVSKLKKKKWIIKEFPEIIQLTKMETIYSIEFNTQHHFKADSAGIVIFQYRYEEHRNESYNRAENYIKNNFKEAIENIKEDLPVKIERSWFENKELSCKDPPIMIPYIEMNIKMKILGISRGGFAIFNVKNHSTEILALWGANFKDFKEMIEKFNRIFRYIPINR